MVGYKPSKKLYLKLVLTSILETIKVLRRFLVEMIVPTPTV